MDSTNKSKKKKVLIILGSILGAILLLLGIGYVVLRSYIGKINYVPLDEVEEEILDEEDIDWDEELIGEVGEDGVDHGEEYDEMIAKNLEKQSVDIMKDKDVLNVLLIGTDNRTSGKRGLSDSMIIVSINSKTKQIVATSLLRDIYLSIPGKQNNRLNAAYIMGGTKLLIDTIESNFKIHIDKYATVDFFSFIHIVDKVGGVTIEITQDELRHFNNYVAHINSLINEEETDGQLASAGTYLLEGKQALAYSRIRYVGTDFARTARQRLVLELMFNKMKDLGVIDLADLMNDIFPEVTTDFSYNEILGLVLKVPTYLNYDIVSWSIPMKGTYKDITVRKMAVLGIDFEKNIDAMYQKIYLGQ